MMMKTNGYIGIEQALKRFGGFVRYFDTTEPLSELAAIVSAGPSQNILACCGGGNQSLTMLGAAPRLNSLCAVDINPAQLFILAAKSYSLKQKNIFPSFAQLRQAYPGRIAAVKRNVRSLRQMYLCHAPTGKLIAPPASLAEKYSLVIDGEMFILPKSGPSWQEDPSFMDRVRANLDCLKLAHMDIFDSPDHFKKTSLDLIYLSDISWQEKLPYFQVKLAKLADLLRPGGRIISYLDPGDDFMGEGISPSRMLVQHAKDLSLKVNQDHDSRYLVLERTRRK
jgi:SAM-dependent methyltransferase